MHAKVAQRCEADINEPANRFASCAIRGRGKLAVVAFSHVRAACAATARVPERPV